MNARMGIALAAIAAMIVSLSTLRAEDKSDAGPDLSKLKCPISGQAVKADKTVDYKDGKVYFCCPKCVAAFTANNAKWIAKANGQLVATGQMVQGACPISGKALNADTTIEVAGAKVTFCCPKCKAATEAATGDAQIEMVFGDAAFTKAKFAKPEAK
jgi:YHS domain-containing protein